MNTAVVQLDQVTKQFSVRGTVLKVLDGVELQIEQGTEMALIGASGSGKSTLLSLMAGLDRPTSGSLTVAGTDLGSVRPGNLAAFRFHHIGFVFQQYHLIPTLSAVENVMLPCTPWRVKYDVRQRATELLELVGLGRRKEHLPAQLSGGEQQRVCIARALINRPTLLLADEPTGNLDEESAAEVLSLLRQLASQFTMTLLFVTHDLAVAASFGRVVRLKSGRMAEE